MSKSISVLIPIFAVLVNNSFVIPYRRREMFGWLVFPHLKGIHIIKKKWYHVIQAHSWCIFSQFSVALVLSFFTCLKAFHRSLSPSPASYHKLACHFRHLFGFNFAVPLSWTITELLDSGYRICLEGHVSKCLKCQQKATCIIVLREVFWAIRLSICFSGLGNCFSGFLVTKSSTIYLHVCKL